LRNDSIPGYRIDRLIGKGGMASVYLATQESLDRPVALKVLRDPDSPEFSERFVNEGRIVASLVHANIITVHDVGIADGLHYIAMEYVDGGDLRARIHDGLAPEMALEVVAKIADCLGFAHQKGVIHRDLKPGNILFRRDGTPVLSDFGIAKSQRLDSDLTRTGKIIGTPHYMSPEQALGKAVDGRSDLYSLGVLLYEMLTGEWPYSGDSEVDTILKHLHDPVPRLPASQRRYQALLSRLLAKDPAERFRDAGELLESLEALRAGREPPSAALCPPAPRRSRPMWWALSALVIAAASMLALFRGAGQDQAPNAPATAPLPPPAPLVDGSNAERLFRLGLDYRQGTGVPADDHKAVELFGAAASQGHAMAQYYLGSMHAQGRGVPKGLEQALRWYEQAARQNLVDAQLLVCLSYALGRGVAQDRVTAYAWCRIAEERGSLEAKKAIAEIASPMSLAHIEKAERLAASIASSIGERRPIFLDAPDPGSGGADPEDPADRRP
jgi:predicted Ser/Thr protein kinase